jgi:ATP-dependent Zn protease
MPPRRTWLTFAIVLLINWYLFRLIFPSPDSPLIVPYTVFKDQAAKGNVVAIYTRGDLIEGRFDKAITWPPEGSTQPSRGEQPRSRADLLNQGPPRSGEVFTTTLPAFVGNDLESFLIEHSVEISAVPIQSGNAWSTLLFGFGPAILIIAFYVWMFRRAAGGGGGMGGMIRASATARPSATTRTPTSGSPSTTWRASTRPRTSWSRSSTSCVTRQVQPRSAAARPRACCWSARPAPARRCWPGPWPARPACPSSR